MAGALRTADNVLEDSMDGISIIIPVYNEEISLPLLCAGLQELRRSLPCPLEILFVDDASSDTSLAFLRKKQCEEGFCTVYAHTQREGQAQALCTGIRHAVYSVIATLDADLEHEPAVIAAMYEVMRQGYDVVLGCRMNRQYKQWHERIYAWIGRASLRHLFGVQLIDPASPIRLCKKHILLSIPVRRGYHRLFTLFFHQDVRVTEYPVVLKRRQFGKSKYSIWKAAECVMSIGVFLVRDIHESRFFDRKSP